MVLSSEALASSHAQALTIIDLPSQSNFDYIPPTMTPYWGGDSPLMEMWRLTLSGGLYDTHTSQCNSFTGTEGFKNILGKFPDGEVMLFTGIATLLENSIENPLPDGGLAVMNRGATLCTNAGKNFLNIESCRLSIGEACESSQNGKRQWDNSINIKENVLVCGVDGEVANDPNLDPTEPRFFSFGHHPYSFPISIPLLRQAVSHAVFLNAQDQLRQRMAFALSQILVISPSQISNRDEEIEIYFNFYDIFVRNALGNYRDVLREVAYSPMVSVILPFSFFQGILGFSKPQINFVRWRKCCHP